MTKQFACLAVLAAFAAQLAPALAADWYTGAESPQIGSFGFSIDSSVTGTSLGDRNLAVIGTISPFSKINNSGLRLSISGGTGVYNYRSAAPGVGTVNGSDEQGSFLAGWKWSAGQMNVTAFAGLDVRNDTLDKFDPDNPSPGTRVGAKVGAEFYANPTPYTMAFGQAYYSTVRSAYYSRFKFGFAIAQDVFVGPEALYLGDTFYQEWRVGAHVTGVGIGPLQFGLSGGLVEDRTRGAGAYGILDMRFVF